MKRILQTLLLELAVIVLYGSNVFAQAPTNYCLWNWQTDPYKYIYDADAALAFDYDEVSGTWTKIISYTGTGNDKFTVVGDDGKGCLYFQNNYQNINADRISEACNAGYNALVITAPTGEYTLKFTVENKDGLAFLSIEGLSSEVSENPNPNPEPGPNPGPGPNPEPPAEAKPDKYSLGGRLESNVFVEGYNKDYLFNYDEATGKWTRTVTVKNGKYGNYFNVYTEDGRSLSVNEGEAFTGDIVLRKLEESPNNNSFRVDGEWTGITLTISEVNGEPYLTVTGFNPTTDEEKWGLKGSFASAAPLEMVYLGDNLFSCYVGDVAISDSFNIIDMMTSPNTIYGGTEALASGLAYTLAEGGAALKFEKNLTDVTITWNSATKSVTATGKSVAIENGGTLRPASTVPDAGSTIVTITEPLKVISLVYTGSQNGIDYIFRQENPTLRLLHDGVVAEVIDVTDVETVNVNRNDPNKLDIYLNTPVTEPGSYSLTIPQDFIELSRLLGGTLGDEEMTEEVSVSRLRNAEYTLTFNVKNLHSFTVSPAVGEVEKEDLYTVTFTYPEGTQVGANPDFNSNIFFPTLYFVDETILEGGVDEDRTRMTEHSKYTMSFSGNVVTLTAGNPLAISNLVNNTQVRYYLLDIPKDAWRVTFNGETQTVPALQLGRYTIKSDAGADESAVTLTPSAENGVVDAGDLQTVVINYPETYTFNAWTASNSMGKKEGYVMGYLRAAANDDDTQGLSIGQYTLTSIDEENSALTLTLSIPTETIVTGKYCISLIYSIFVLPDGKTRSGLMYFPGYSVEGIDGDNTTGVNAVETATGDVKWLDMQGNNVKSPAHGLYIRIEDGKAVKVMLP